MSTIFHLENDHIAIDLDAGLSGRFRDKRRGVDWEMSPACYEEYGALSEQAVWNREGRWYMDRYPAAFRAEAVPGGLRVRVLDPLREERGALTCRIALEGEWVRFTLEEIADELPSLVFPPFIVSESLVVPRGIGQWIRQPIPESTFIMPASGWGMRFVGGLRGDAGWIAVVDQGHADSGLYMAGLTACPAWQKSMGRWSGARSVLYGFTGGGYVGIAKRFRAYARDRGLHRSLRDKAADLPAVANLVGGRCLSVFQGHTEHADNARLWMSPVSPEAAARDGHLRVLVPHRDASTILREAREAGMRRGFVNLRGWLRGGYDETHPHVWPPEPGLGTLDEFRALLAERDPFLTLLHDNYQDTYTRSPTFPEHVQRTPDGRLKPGGTWHGGRCYLLNAEKARLYLEANWRHFQACGLRGIFLDTVGGAHFQEDWSPAHPATRAQDAAAKRELIRFHKANGLLVGTEIGSDTIAADADFIETRHERVPGRSIPLWPLVYHDACVTLRYATGTDDFEAARDQEDLLWGYAKLWPAGTLEHWRTRRSAFARSLAVDDWHARIGWDEMTNHRYLDAEGLVECTEFSSGLGAIGNFSREPFAWRGRVVEPDAVAIVEGA